MNAAQARTLAQRLVLKGASRTTWTRSYTVSGGASGETSQSKAPDTYDNLPASQLSPDAEKMFSAEWWKTASVRLVIAAADLPFDPSAVSGDPEIQFDDVVIWASRSYRVAGVEVFRAPSGRTSYAQPYLYFVALVA